MSPEQAGRLIAKAHTRSPRAFAIVIMLYTTDLSVSELAGALAADLSTDRVHRVLTITRAGQRHDVVLPPGAAVALDTYLLGRRYGPLIATVSGRPMRPQDIWQLLSSLARQAGVPKIRRSTFRGTWP